MRRVCAQVGKPILMFLRLGIISSRLPCIWMISITSGIEKSPISAGTSMTPSIRPVMPKVKRGTPSSGSIPMVPMSMPRNPEMYPLTIIFSLSEAMMVIPKMASTKYSGGPNISDTRASGGAKSCSTITPRMPPTNDETTDSRSASAARPCLAIG